VLALIGGGVGIEPAYTALQAAAVSRQIKHFHRFHFRQTRVFRSETRCFSKVSGGMAKVIFGTERHDFSGRCAGSNREVAYPAASPSKSQYSQREHCSGARRAHGHIRTVEPRCLCDCRRARRSRQLAKKRAARCRRNARCVDSCVRSDTWPPIFPWIRI
jgi:hypothetical protein